MLRNMMLPLVILDHYVGIGHCRVKIISSNRHYVADGSTECAIQSVS